MARPRANSASRAQLSGTRDRALGREQVTDLQRARILAAMFDVSCERGAANVTVAHVVERSGVSRRTFYEVFEDREDCFLAAFDQALAYACERVLPAYEAEGDWRKKVRAGLIALLAFLDEEPVIGRVLIVESLGGGRTALERRGEVIAKLTDAIDRGGKAVKATSQLPPLTAEGVVGGVLSIIHSQLTSSSARSEKRVIDLSNPLMSMIVLPYLGSAEARREMERPVPKPSGKARPEPLLSDPFKEAGMRLTYRTVRVLLAIGEHPGASNRLIGDSAEIRDQGQVSKLLTRLQRVGMITNTGLGAGQGGPNSWTLTPAGRQVVSTVSAHIEGNRLEGSTR